MPQLAQFLLGFQGPTAYALVFLVLLLCGFGVPIPEDVTLIAAGILAYYGAANVWGMIAIGFAGVMIGDSAMFWLGRRYGLALAKKPFLSRFLTEARLAQVAEALKTKGDKILFAARFMPGLRSPLFFSAGALGVPARVFLFYDGLAALLSVPAIVYAVYYFGHQLEEVVAFIRQANQGVVAVIVVVSAFFIVRWRIRRKKELKDRPVDGVVTASGNQTNVA